MKSPSQFTCKCLNHVLRTVNQIIVCASPMVILIVTAHADSRRRRSDCISKPYRSSRAPKTLQDSGPPATASPRVCWSRFPPAPPLGNVYTGGQSVDEMRCPSSCMSVRLSVGPFLGRTDGQCLDRKLGVLTRSRIQS
jgi:hypothetical protein